MPARTRKQAKALEASEIAKDMPPAKRSKTANRKLRLPKVRPFLESKTIEDVLVSIDKKGPQDVVTLSHSSTVGEAMKELAERKILSAPVVIRASALEDSEGDTYQGFVDTHDILVALTNWAKERNNGDHRWATVEANTQEFFNTKLIVIAENEDVDLEYQGNTQVPLKQALLKGFGISPRGETVSAGDSGDEKKGKKKVQVHRIALFDAQGQITHIISQSDVVAFIFEHLKTLGGLAKKTLEELDLTHTDGVETVLFNTKVMDCYAKMRELNVSSVGITSSSGALISSIGVSDLRGLTTEDFHALDMPVDRFLLAHVAPLSEEQKAIHDKSREDEAYPHLELDTVSPSTKFEDLLKIFVEGRKHRAYVVDEAGKPLAAVTLTDVLQVLASL